MPPFSTAFIRLCYYWACRSLLLIGLVLASTKGQAQTARTCKWDGGANTTNFSDAANWDNDQLPADNDNVALDHSYVLKDYTVVLNSETGTKILNSLTINPGTGDSIRVEVPSINTTPLTLTLTGTGGTALAIYNKGVFTNASSATSGTIVDIKGAAATLFIYNGGTYRHYSISAHTAVAENLSSVAGTENGYWVFRNNGGVLSLSGRSYPNLILRNSLTQSITNYRGSGANILTVRGNLIIGPNVTFAPTLTGEIRIAGNIVGQGTMRFIPDNSGTAGTGRLVLNGKATQVISGLPFGPLTTNPNYLSPGVTVQINNTAGVTLQSPMTVNGTLELINGLLNTSTTNLLTLANNAQGGSNASFVNGPVARTATTAGSIVFPLGRNTATGIAYRPLTLDITTLAAPTTFTATQQEGACDVSNLTGDLKRVSKVRSFQVTPSPIPSAGQFEGTITLSFGPDDFITNPEASTLVVAKNSGSGWASIGHSANTGTASNGAYVAGTLTSAPFTSFSQFAIGNTDASFSQNPLPVTLTSFSATWRAEGILLCWTTATEKDNNHFDVQRSTDGLHFKTIDRREGQKQSTQTNAYASVDSHTPEAALVYYRLCQVDEDGTTTYSPVRTIKPSTNTGFIHPNPATDHIGVHLLTAEKVEYCIMNVIGQVVLSGKVSNGDVVYIGDLPNGIYYFKIRTVGSRSTHKFIKK